MSNRITPRETLKRLISSTVFRLRDELRKKLRAKQLARRHAQEDARLFANKNPREAFSLIYDNFMWGRGPEGDFFSGSGSHEASVVDAYVAAVASFLDQLPARPNVVDLGCGDFNIGAQLRHHSARYIGCDVVPALIAHNAAKFGTDDVEFRCIDITEERAPAADVVFVRQVLQHLSNAQISRFVEHLPCCRYLLVTEHHPAKRFVPNVDKPIGHGTRMHRQIGKVSGVVLTKPPFNLVVLSSDVICEVPQHGGVIRTYRYELPASNWPQ